MKRCRIGLLILLLLAVAVGCVWLEGRREGRFEPQIRAAASRYGVDPLLVKAVIWRESRFNPRVRGSHGEIGLMQIQELTAQEWADAEHVRPFRHESCFDPGTNTLAGTFYLGKLLKRYVHTDNPLPYALADYNAGRGNVLKWKQAEASTNSAAFIRHIGFPGTRKYVESVMHRYSLYKFLAWLGLS